MRHRRFAGALALTLVFLGAVAWWVSRPLERRPRLRFSVVGPSRLHVDDVTGTPPSPPLDPVPEPTATTTVRALHAATGVAVEHAVLRVDATSPAPGGAGRTTVARSSARRRGRRGD